MTVAAARELIIVGAGGLGRETAELVRAVNAREPTWDLLGFVDDAPALAGAEVAGLPVLGPVASVVDHPGAALVVCVGHPGCYWSKRRIVESLGLGPDRYATLVHPAAVVSACSGVGPGTVILATAVATAAVRIGPHVTVMPGAVLTHDDVVGDYATLAAGTRVAGRARVGDGAYLGAGALVAADRSVGPWALVGMGAVVVRDVPAGEVWAGVPAGRLREAGVPADVLGSS
jgi:sugar O-acyltransferase (sialic acid O-acetyltransferase NeuD family)